tara:strand:+ start:164 stop:490 length:327 start_codon:yes stop_codon:yes gene_type:complete
MSAEEIYATIKEADNKKNWAIAQELAKYRREAKRRNTGVNEDIDFTDKPSLQKKVMTHLFIESGKGNAQASDKLAKIAGLENASQDINIMVIDFANAYEEHNTATTET